MVVSRRFVFLFLILLVLSACTDSPTMTPAAQPATAANTPTFTPTNTAVAEETTEQFVTIKNEDSGTYLYQDGDKVKTGALDPQQKSMLWIIEEYQGNQRLRNRSTAEYISIEHLLGTVECIPVEAVWMSPRWTFDTDPAAGPTFIRSVWHTWEVLFVNDSGELTYGRPPVLESQANWIIEPLYGTSWPAATPQAQVQIPPAANPPESRGAQVPWTTYEAEKGETNGEILAPERTFGSIASESSERSAVKLSQPGDYLQITTTEPANAIVIRYVIPDSEDGLGLDVTLSLYVNGIFLQKLSLTSRYAWSYGGREYAFNSPGGGGEHHFYDETRALFGEIPSGSTIRLQIDVDDSADYYVVDLLELEKVPAPLTQPEGYLSITEDCGAIANDGLDDGDAIRTCIYRAQQQGSGVWMPEGTFESLTRGFDVKEVTIQGAGMWYTTLHGLYARFNCVGDGCRYADFSILGETTQRDDASPENGFNGGAGTGSRLDNIWVEHTKVGYWVGGLSRGLVISGSRFRNLFADGVNFCNGTSYSVVENSHFRNTGDDAVASWSPQDSAVNTNNVFRFNTIQIPWRANCFAIYGGKDNRIENNICADTVMYPGILIAQQFNANPFEGSTSIINNTLLRAGGEMYNDQHGALKIWADMGPVIGVEVHNTDIIAATYSGIDLEGGYAIEGVKFETIQIEQPGTYGIQLRSNLEGDAEFMRVSVINAGKDSLLNYAPKNRFVWVKGEGNEGW